MNDQIQPPVTPQNPEQPDVAAVPDIAVEQPLIADGAESPVVEAAENPFYKDATRLVDLGIDPPDPVEASPLPPVETAAAEAVTEQPPAQPVITKFADSMPPLSVDARNLLQAHVEETQLDDKDKSDGTPDKALPHENREQFEELVSSVKEKIAASEDSIQELKEAFALLVNREDAQGDHYFVTRGGAEVAVPAPQPVDQATDLSQGAGLRVSAEAEAQAQGAEQPAPAVVEAPTTTPE